MANITGIENGSFSVIIENFCFIACRTNKKKKKKSKPVQLLRNHWNRRNCYDRAPKAGHVLTELSLNSYRRDWDRLYRHSCWMLLQNDLKVSASYIPSANMIKIWLTKFYKHCCKFYVSFHQNDNTFFN